MLDAFLELLRRVHPELPVAWGQMATYGRRRSAAVYQRFGWKFYDQARLTKYDRIARAWDYEAPPHARLQLPEIHLTTIYKEVMSNEC